MKLLVFAHKAEAQCFIRDLKEETLPKTKIKYFRSTDCFILIVGQGVFYSSIKLSYFCGMFRSDISDIVNLGIAGSLSNELRKGKVYSVSSVQNRDGSKLILHKHDGVRCFTSDKILRTSGEREEFSIIAECVDMELWGLVATSKQFKIPIQSYKLISDIVGEETKCEGIKHQALEYSEELYKNFTSTP